MKLKILTFLVICSFSVPAFAQRRSASASLPSQSAGVATNSNQLPIRRVILYSNGVAYIERRGIVSGNAEVNLSFKQSQVDDVLKSMVVLDLGQGRIGAVSYNSSAPPSSRIAEIPFSIGAAEVGGMAEVLTQLQGAKVAVSSNKGAMSGSILTVEKRNIQTDASKPPIAARFLVIATESGEISSFDLADVKSVKLLDEGTRKDVNEFANVSASTRRRDAKTITVTSDGNGQREMVVSYIIAAPIWKTTYRVVLDEAGKPFFQGWAIVDNVSDEDWSNVKLSLVSGSPISFIQPIQQPFYRYRPIVPIPDDLKLSPQVYEEQKIGDLPKGTSTPGVLKAVPGTRAEPNSGGFQVDGASSNENTMIIDGQEISNFRTGALRSNQSFTGTDVKVGDAMVGESSGVKTAASGGEIGDLFEYKIDQPLTVLRDRSALIPIVQSKLEGERASIYNEATRRDRPMSGMLLNNTTNLTFEGGSLTVLDRDAYAGEALMERLKAKEQRLISFALDLGTNVRVRSIQDREPAKSVKVVNGVFQVAYFQTNEKTYQITNQTDRNKVLYIEYPVKDGWVLSDKTPKPDYTTQRYHRFRVELNPFEEKNLTVAEKQPLMESYELEDVDSTELELFVSRKYIDDATKAKLSKLIELRLQINRIEQNIKSLASENSKIAADQKRFRENIEALSKTPEAKVLITRYIDKANAQETRIEAIEKETAVLEKEKEKIEKQLETEILNFELK